jgi:hypothetical protein
MITTLTDEGQALATTIATVLAQTPGRATKRPSGAPAKPGGTLPVTPEVNANLEWL